VGEPATAEVVQLAAMATTVFRRTREWARASDTVRRWREGRYQLFMDACSVQPGDRILDVGAGAGSALERFNRTNEIVAIDLAPRPGPWLQGDNVTVQTADATQMPFADGEFQVAFSNSVIEHVPVEKWQAFADEVRRVAPRYFIQTPNRWFPVEPHYQTPFFQFLPERAQRAINARVTLGHRKKGHWEHVRLLSASDMRRLFPDAEIHREKVLGLTKSLMAIKR
jgi:SAM-dependent methyltransferase